MLGTRSLQPKRRWRTLLMLFVLGAIGAGFYYGWLATGENGPTLFPGFTIGGRPQETKVPNILNGAPSDPDLANRRPLAIMVENHTLARPQVGLDKAAIVYEAIAEGGITRFLAVFGPFESDKIGPVRSARQYYAEWAKGLNALYAHIGGSQDGLAKIRELGLSDLDQFRWGTRAYWREPRPGVATEHTLMTSTAKLYAVAKQAKFSLEADFKPYLFKDDEPAAQRGTAQTITVNFSVPTYKVTWLFDPTTNNYLRSHGGAEHRDRLTNERLTAKNVILATVKRQLKPEEQGVGYFMTTTGTGKARVFQDGREISGTWRREAVSEMIRFFDGNGVEVKLNRGPLWIEIVHSDTPVSVQ